MAICPTLISGTFGPQLILNINDKIEGAYLCTKRLFCTRLMLPAAKKVSPQICLCISFPQRGQANKPRLIFPLDRNMLAALYLIAQILQFFEQLIKGTEILLQDGVDGIAQEISVFDSVRIGRAFCPLLIRFRGDYRESVFKTDQVADPLQSNTRQPEVFELPGFIQGSGIEHDVVE